MTLLAIVFLVGIAVVAVAYYRRTNCIDYIAGYKDGLLRGAVIGADVQDEWWRSELKKFRLLRVNPKDESTQEETR